MSYQITYKKDNDIVRIKVSGTRNFENALSIIKDTRRIYNKHGISRVLLDIKGLVGHLKTIEAYEIPASSFPKIRENHIIEKGAIVDLEESRENFYFFETVAVNRSFNIKFFTNIEDASECFRK